MSDTEGWPTTRSFPRSEAEAFRDSSYAQPFTVYRGPSRWERFCDACWWAGGLVIVSSVLAFAAWWRP